LEKPVPGELLESLRRQRYHLVGGHSAVKRCRWLWHSIVDGRPCYKQRFYGIETHRCLQMTPSLFDCTMNCLFCWRIQPGDLGLSFSEGAPARWDEPEEIIEGCLRVQKAIVSGYKSNLKADRQKYIESLQPRHVAISLAGEPTLYPDVGDLIGGFHKRGFTTFLVTNGTLPEAFSHLSCEPTQLYVSLYAYNEALLKRTCRPKLSDAWERIQETLNLLSSFNCKTVVRLTLVKGLNLEKPEEYARVLEGVSPTYVEAKAYMHVGFSQLRLGYENMPTHEDIREFSKRLKEGLSYNLLDEAVDSRVVLLSRLEKPIKLSRQLS